MVLCYSYCTVVVKVFIYGKKAQITVLALQLLITGFFTTLSLACLTLILGWIGVKYTESELPRAS